MNFADSNKLVGPSHYYGIKVPDVLRETWETDQGMWWREGALQAIAAFRMDLDKASVYGIRP